MAWSGTAHALVAELGVGAATHSTLQLALGVAALLAGLGVVCTVMGVAFIWDTRRKGKIDRPGHHPRGTAQGHTRQDGRDRLTAKIESIPSSSTTPVGPSSEGPTGASATHWSSYWKMAGSQGDERRSPSARIRSGRARSCGGRHWSIRRPVTNSGSIRTISGLGAVCHGNSGRSSASMYSFMLSMRRAVPFTTTLHAVASTGSYPSISTRDAAAQHRGREFRARRTAKHDRSVVDDVVDREDVGGVGDQRRRGGRPPRGAAGPNIRAATVPRQESAMRSIPHRWRRTKARTRGERHTGWAIKPAFANARANG